jgi:hypothetical protein
MILINVITMRLIRKVYPRKMHKNKKKRINKNTFIKVVYIGSRAVLGTTDRLQHIQTIHYIHYRNIVNILVNTSTRMQVHTHTLVCTLHAHTHGERGIGCH